MIATGTVVTGCEPKRDFAMVLVTNIDTKKANDAVYALSADLSIGNSAVISQYGVAIGVNQSMRRGW